MKSLLFVSALTLTTAHAVAQKSTTPAPVASPGRTTTPGLPTTSQPNTFPSTNTTNTNNTGALPPRPIYVSGKVIMEDGTPPPDLVRVEKVCGGSPRPEGYTDSKGRFSFQLDAGMDVMADASDANFGRLGGQSTTTMSSSTRERNLTGCDIRASLPGFRSDSVNLGFHGSMDNPNVGSIVLHRIGNVEGTTISMTTLNAPKDAQKAYLKGREALKKEKDEEAAKNFQKAVDEYPKFAVAWFELGKLQLQQNQMEQAEKSFQHAAESDAKFVSPYLQLSLLSLKAKDWTKAVEMSGHVIKLNPSDFPEAYFYNAVGNLNNHNLEAAKKSALEAQKLDTQHHISQLPKLLDAITASQKPTAER